ncbi:MAG: PA2779 family protein [Gammaproteobacteria bacterium]|nr:PA2779 family protein [Gammaproteobacteria bacterium]
MKQSFKKITAVMMAVALLAQGYIPAAQAGLIGTQTVMQSETRETILSKTDAWLAQQTVADQLEQMGVDQADVKQRMQMMTDNELQTLAAKMDNMPAGADALEVIGIIFIVLLILELLGVTNIFNRL